MPEHPHRIDQTRALLYHARAATPFCSEDGEPCASIPSTLDSRRVVALRSATFRDWLTANFYSEYETAPSTTAFRAALRLLEARARFGEMPVQKVSLRLGSEGDPGTPLRIILDLSNSAGEVLEISSQGWKTAGNLSHPFHQSPASLPLPSPESPNSRPLEQFAEIFRLSARNRTLALSWLASALRPSGPYPVLVLRGPAASGKSVLARALRALIDPSTAPLRRIPSRDRELHQLALQNWIMAFDSVHRIPSKIAAGICALSSGDAFEMGRADREPIVMQLARPVILVSAATDDATPAWNLPRTLAARALSIDLPPMGALRAEASLWAQFEALRPAILGALATAVSMALRRIREVDLVNVARFADCANWAAAAAPALALDPADIVEAFADPAFAKTART